MVNPLEELDVLDSQFGIGQTTSPAPQDGIAKPDPFAELDELDTRFGVGVFYSEDVDDRAVTSEFSDSALKAPEEREAERLARLEELKGDETLSGSLARAGQRFIPTLKSSVGEAVAFVGDALSTPKKRDNQTQEEFEEQDRQRMAQDPLLRLFRAGGKGLGGTGRGMAAAEEPFLHASKSAGPKEFVDPVTGQDKKIKLNLDALTGSGKPLLENAGMLADPRWWAENVIDVAASSAPTLVVGAANPIAGAAIGGLQEAGNLNAQLQKDGVKAEEAIQYAAAYGLVSSALEKIGLDAVFGAGTLTKAGKDWAKSRAVGETVKHVAKAGAKGFVGEGSTEQLQDMFQSVFEGLAKGEGMDKIGQRVADGLTTLNTFFAAGPSGGAISTVRGVQEAGRAYAGKEYARAPQPGQGQAEGTTGGAPSGEASITPGAGQPGEAPGAAQASPMAELDALDQAFGVAAHLQSPAQSPAQAPTPAKPSHQLGAIVMGHESRGDAGAIGKNAGDIGGASYGSYQLATNTGTLQRFLDSTPYGTQFTGLAPGSSAFDAKWKELAKGDPEFAHAQHDFILTTHYEPVRQHMVKTYNLDPDGNAGMAEAVLAVANGHGEAGARRVLDRVLADNPGLTPEQLVARIYDERLKRDESGGLSYYKRSSAGIQKSVANRLVEEKEQVLALARGESPASRPVMTARVTAPSGTIRAGLDANGQYMERPSTEDAGEIELDAGGRIATVDAFLGPKPEADAVFMVNQQRPDGTFAGTVAMLGYSSAEEARAAYADNAPEGGPVMSGVVATSRSGLRQWLASGETDKPVPVEKAGVPSFMQGHATPEELRQLAGTLDEKGNLAQDKPTPESQKTIDAQLAAVLDPKSTKRAMLVTPGSPMPGSIPPEVIRVDTPRGVVLTTDRKAAKSLVADASIENMGRWVLGYGQGKPLEGDRTVRALDGSGNVVGEVLTDHAGEAKAVKAMKGQSPEGAADVVPALQALEERHGLVEGEGRGIQTVRAEEPAGAAPFVPVGDVHDTVFVEPGQARIKDIHLSEALRRAQPVPFEEGVSAAQVRAAVEARNGKALWDLLRLSSNKKSRALYFELTRQDPKRARTQKELRTAIEEWVNPPKQAEERESSTRHRPETTPDASDPKEGWEKSLAKARKYAEELGLNSYGKNLLAIVGEIKAHLAESSRQSSAHPAGESDRSGKDETVVSEEKPKSASSAAVEDAVYRALHNMSGAKARWDERREKGMTDQALKEAIAYEVGLWGGFSTDNGVSVSFKGGDNPIINYGSSHPQDRRKGTLIKGAKLLEMARKILEMPTPEAVAVSGKSDTSVVTGKQEKTDEPAASTSQADAHLPDGEGSHEAVPAGDVRGPRKGRTSPRSTAGSPGELRAGGGAGDGSTRGQGVDEVPGDSRSQRDRAKELHSPGADSGRGGRGGLGPEAEAKAHSELPSAANYRITEADGLGKGGKVAKFGGNVAAIKLLKALEAEKRQATPEEQAVLVKYVGWGMFPEIFNQAWTPDRALSERRRTVLDLLTQQEYEAARSSTLNAHYTSDKIVSAMWSLAERLGFKGGHVLEPAVGTGNFLGLVPDRLYGGTTFVGIELDPTTASIAKHLYPGWSIRNRGFEKSAFADGTFDLAIGNVPFGAFQLYEKRYSHLKLNIHDHFFVKALDKVRPGGLVMFITSSGSMNSRASDRMRQEVDKQADFLGAVRLPGDAFKENAGTEVTTDLIVLRKRLLGESPAGLPWHERKGSGVRSEVADKELLINEYYAAHPEMMLGRIVDDTLIPGRAALESNGDLAEQLDEAIKRFPANVMRPHHVDGTAATPLPEEVRRVREGQYLVGAEGKLVQVQGGVEVAAPADSVKARRIEGMVAVRDALRNVLDRQASSMATEAQVEDTRAALNKVYDAFVMKHGFLSDRANVAAFKGDPDAALLKSLEVNYMRGEDGVKASSQKADIFFRRTVSPPQAVDKVDTVQEALVVSLGERGRIDVPFMTSLLGASDDASVEKQLKGMAFQDPTEGRWVAVEEYLSGPVRQKLKEAREAAEQDGRYKENVEALEKVQPEEVPASAIACTLGANWIPRGYYTQFIARILNVGERNVAAVYESFTGTWSLKVDSGYASNQWGTGRMSATDLIGAAMNFASTKVYDTYTEHGTEKRVINQKETLAAEEAKARIQAEFARWLVDDPKRAKVLQEIYNDTFNGYRLRSFEGQHLAFPGMTKVLHGEPFDLRPNQKGSVWRIIQDGNTLLDHCVGAGKTFTMQAASMELKRLGLKNKPMHVVKNHMIDQYASEFLALYPGARLLVATKDDFSKERRKELFSRIATGNWDAVIVPHSSFGKMAVSADFEEQWVKEQLADLRAAKLAMAREMQGRGKRAGRFGNAATKAIEAAMKRFEARLEKLMEYRERADDILSFEELGVDQLFVDEAHNFKNLFTATKMTRVAGVQQSMAQKAQDLFLKITYLESLYPDRSTVFATGTPISNTMVEMFTMMRYLMLPELRRAGLGHFDAWAAQFGSVVKDYEIDLIGTSFREKERFNRFNNLPELLTMYRSFADVKTAEDLDLPVPKVKGGKSKTVVSERSAELEDYIGSLLDRAERLQKGNIDPRQDNMLKVTNDGRKAALDLRLIDDTFADHPGSKVNQAVENILDVWRRTANTQGGQLVFCDLSVPAKQKTKELSRIKKELAEAEKAGRDPKVSEDDMLALSGKGSFSVYDDIKAKLLAKGIPEKEVAFIHDAGTDEAKARLFSKVRSGEIRVLLGSTAKMGEGTNVQRNLVALHHLDAPWRPSDVEQRDGRIIRQGNLNDEVEIFRYVTEKSFDAYLWQTLENKAKFIAAAKVSGTTARSMDDVAMAALSYAEAKAASSGDSRIMDKARIDGKVAKLSAMRSAWRDRNRTVLFDVEHRLPSRIAENEDLLKGHESDAKKVEGIDLSGENFSISLFGKEFAERAEAAQALEAWFKKHKKGADILDVTAIGKIGGMDVVISSPAGFTEAFRVGLRGEGVHQSNMGESFSGAITRLENLVSGLQAETPYKARIEAARKELADKKEWLTKSGVFEQQAELDDALVQQRELNIALGIIKEEEPSGKFALSESSGHASTEALAAIRAEVERLQAGATGAVPVEVHASQDELPEHLRPGRGRVLGVYDPDARRVHLVADNLAAGQTSSAIVRAVAETYWRHEQVGHWGLEGLFREMHGNGWERPFNRFLDHVARSAPRTELRALAGKYGFDLGVLNDRRAAAEEYFAHIAQDVREGARLDSAQRTLWRAFVDLVEAWLKKLGLVKLTRADIVKVAADALRFVRRGETPGRSDLPAKVPGMQPAPAFALKPGSAAGVRVSVEKGVTARVGADRALMRSPRWIAAKGGDMEAARAVVNRMWTPAKTEALRKVLAAYNNPVLVSPPSSSRGNVLPLALGEKLASELGVEFHAGETYWRAAHDEQSKNILPAERPFKPRLFNLKDKTGLGADLGGRDVVVVEDVLTTGQTAFQFAQAMEVAGVRVRSVAALMGDPRLVSEPQLVDKLQRALRNAHVPMKAKELAGVLSRGEINVILDRIQGAGPHEREQLAKDLSGLLDGRSAGSVPRYSLWDGQGNPAGEGAGNGQAPGAVRTVADPQAPRGKVETGQGQLAKPRSPRHALADDAQADAGGSPSPRPSLESKSGLASLEMPELVHLTRQLMGTTPKILKRMRGEHRGQFTPGGISLRADLFKGEQIGSVVTADPNGVESHFLQGLVEKHGVPLESILVEREGAGRGRTRITAWRTDVDVAPRVLAHEIGHLIDYLPDSEMRRGNLVGHLATLKGHLKGFLDGVSNREVRDEVKALSKWWRPWDEGKDPSHDKYRNSAKELYADALSVLLNAPGELQARAPKFHDAFFDWLDRKPEVRDVYQRIQDGLKSGQSFTDRVKRLREGFRRGDEAYRDFYDRPFRTSPTLRKLFVDEFSPVYGLLTEKRPRWLVERAIYSGSEKEAYVREVYHEVLKPLEASGLTAEDLGEWLFHRRVASERSRMANPQGFTEKASGERLEEMAIEFGAERFGALEAAGKRFREIRAEWITAKMDASGMFTEELVKTIQESTDYATFDVVDYIEKRLGAGMMGARIFRQVGTLKDVSNPLTATMMKDLTMLGSINWNTAKKAVVDDLLKHRPSEIEEADYQWNGKSHVPSEPSSPDKGLVVYMERGKAKGWYVDSFAAEAFAKERSETLTYLGRLLGALATPYRMVFTQLRPGFQAFNLIRDFRRTVMNLPGANPEQALMKHYVMALRPAWKSIFGVPEETVKEMERGNMLISVADPAGLSREDEQLERLLQSWRVKPKEYKTQVLKPFGKLFALALDLGGFLERVPKVASYTYLKERFPELDHDEIGHIIRGQAGSPGFLYKGEVHPVTNNIFLFSNAFKEGWRSDYEAMRANPKAWWWKWVKWSLVPRLAMYGMAAGLMGAGLKMILDGASEYDKTNFLIIPLGLTAEGKSVYLRLPQEEFARVSGGIMWKLLHSEKRNTWPQLFDYVSGQAPTLNPAFEVAGQSIAYLSGRNPYEPFRGRNVIEQTTFEAGGWESHKQMLQWMWNASGGGIVHTFRGGDVETVKGELETILGMPVASDMLGRFLKVSDQGVREDLRETRDEVRQQSAKEVLAARKALAKLVNGEQLDHEDSEAILNKMDYAQKKIIPLITRKNGQTLATELLAAKSKEEKFAVLKKWQEIGGAERTKAKTD